jgi:hypothetical protein
VGLLMEIGSRDLTGTRRRGECGNLG